MQRFAVETPPRPLAGVTITVRIAGTQTIAEIFNYDNSPKVNPFTLPAGGDLEFYANANTYDIYIGGTSSIADKAYNGGVAWVVEGVQLSDALNGYTHPATHPADMIVEDIAHRFATDYEKGVWNAKETTTGAQAKADAALAAANTYTDSSIADLVGTVPATLDTLNELAAALGNDPNFATTMIDLINTKVDKEVGKKLTTEDYSTADKNKLAGIEAGANYYVHPATHAATMIVEDTTHRFVTDTDKTNWNLAKAHADSAHAPSNAQKNSDILKSEIEAVLTGNLTSHTHSYLPLTGGTVTGTTTVSSADLIMTGTGNLVTVNPMLGRMYGNEMWMADKFATVTYSGAVSNPLNVFRSGDNYATFSDGNPVVWEITGLSLSATTSVTERRIIVFPHGSYTGNLKLEVLRADDTWATAYDGAVSLTGSKWYKYAFNTAAPYPSAWSVKGLRFTFSGYQAGTNCYIGQLGVNNIRDYNTFTYIGREGGVSYGNVTISNADLTARYIFDGFGGTSSNWNTAYTHSQSAHAPSDAQKNSDITKAEIEAKLTGEITSHTHAAAHSHTNLATLETITSTLTGNWSTGYSHSQATHARTDATLTESSVNNGKIKINGVEVVVYTHPASHAATMITEDSTHRFITDTERTNWGTAYTHSQAAHAPSNAQKNSDITKAEIEAKLIGDISSHTHSNYDAVAPAAPTGLVLTDLDDAVQVTFSQSATSGVDTYEIWRSEELGGASGFNLVAVVKTDEIAAQMTVVDNYVSIKGTIYYQVYAVRQGKRSSALAGNLTTTGTVDDVTGLTVTAYYDSFVLEYDAPVDPRLAYIEIKVDAQEVSANLAEGNAITCYQGADGTFTYKIPTGNLDKYHKFWVYTITRT